MPAQPIERTRKLIDAAQANGILSDDESRAMRSVLNFGDLDPQRLERELAVLVGQLDRLRRDLVARRRALHRFCEHVGYPEVLLGTSSRRATAGTAMISRGDETGSNETEVSETERRRIHWTGNLGRVIGPDAEYSRGIPEPAYFTQSLCGREAMILTVEAYVPGLTDHPSADLSSLWVEAVTSLGAAEEQMGTFRLEVSTQGKRVNNNVRAHWDISALVRENPPGRYPYQFRLSNDHGQQWVYVPETPHHLVIVADATEIPPEARTESSLLRKVGEIGPSRIGWLGQPTVRTAPHPSPRPLPAEAILHEAEIATERGHLELAVQVWAPGVSNRADLMPEEHTLALRQLGVHLESSFFGGSGEALGFAGKAGIHEHDDVARFNLQHYLLELLASGKPTPPAGDYELHLHAGERRLGTLLLHWRKP